MPRGCVASAIIISYSRKTQINANHSSGTFERYGVADTWNTVLYIHLGTPIPMLENRRTIVKHAPQARGVIVIAEQIAFNVRDILLELTGRRKYFEDMRATVSSLQLTSGSAWVIEPLPRSASYSENHDFTTVISVSFTTSPFIDTSTSALSALSSAFVGTCPTPTMCEPPATLCASAKRTASRRPFSTSTPNQMMSDAAKHNAKRNGKPFQLLPMCSVNNWFW